MAIVGFAVGLFLGLTSPEKDKLINDYHQLRTELLDAYCKEKGWTQYSGTQTFSDRMEVVCSNGGTEYSEVYTLEGVHTYPSDSGGR